MAGKEDIVTRIAHKSGLTKKATYKLMEDIVGWRTVSHPWIINIEARV